MLNHRTSDPVAFEPDYLKIQPGHMVVFPATYKVTTRTGIDGRALAGFPAFKSKIDEERNITFDQSGFYGTRSPCIMHQAWSCESEWMRQSFPKITAATNKSGFA